MHPIHYEEYLQLPQSLESDTALRLYEEIAAEIGADETALELYEELSEMAARYAGFRSSWLLWGREERISRDESRTACHDSLIVRFNQLARYLRSQGKDAAWRDVLGYEEEDRYCRKRIGDFGCFISFMNELQAR